MSNVAHEIAVRHFGKKAVKALASRGIRVIGLCVIPDMSKPMPFASGETGYNVDDNGTGRVWSYFEVAGKAK